MRSGRSMRFVAIVTWALVWSVCIAVMRGAPTSAGYPFAAQLKSQGSSNHPVPAAEEGTPFAFRLGSAYRDYGKDVAVDAAGNIYVAGYFQSTVDFDPGPERAERTSAGDPSHPATGASAVDIFLAKYDANGEFLWVDAIGDRGADMPHTIKLDHQGNVYATGYFSGLVDFDPSPGTANLAAGIGRDAFVAKYSSSGDLLWALAIGDPETSPTAEESWEDGLDLALDESGNVYVTGVFSGTVDLERSDRNDSEDTFISNARDIFVASYDTVGNYRWGFAIGGPGPDSGQAIDVGADGTCYVAGFFSDVADFEPGMNRHNVTSAGGWDAFFAKYSAADGSLMWVKGFGGSVNDQVRPGGIVVDGEQHVYLCGDFGDTTDFDPGPGTVELTSNGSGDIFIANYDADGNYQWAIGMGDTGLDGAHRVELDSQGNLITTGWFRGTVDFDPDPYISRTLTGASDVFLAKYTATGDLLWAHGFGDAVSIEDEWSQGTGVAVDGSDNVIATGRFYGTVNFDPGAAVLELSSSGRADVFLLKLDAEGNLRPQGHHAYLPIILKGFCSRHEVRSRDCSSPYISFVGQRRT